MQILINQRPIHCTSHDTLDSVLNVFAQGSGVDINDIAVAADNKVIARSQWATYALTANASFSVFVAVAGG